MFPKRYKISCSFFFYVCDKLYFESSFLTDVSSLSQQNKSPQGLVGLRNLGNTVRTPTLLSNSQSDLLYSDQDSVVLSVSWTPSSNVWATLQSWGITAWGTFTGWTWAAGPTRRSWKVASPLIHWPTCQQPRGRRDLSCSLWRRSRNFTVTLFNVLQP